MDAQRRIAYKNRALAAGGAGAIVLLLLVGNLAHWFRLATDAEYSRCWSLVEEQLPIPATVHPEVVISDEEIRWSGFDWDGDKYLPLTRICKRGSEKIEKSALD